MNVMSRWVERYFKLSQEVKATIWYTLCNILVRGLSLITVPIFTRILSEADYGIVSVYSGWHDIFFIFGTLNLFYAVYNNAMLKYKDDIDGYTSSMIILIDAISMSIFVVYCVSPYFWENVFGLSPTLLRVVFIELITVPAYYFWMSKQRFFFQYKKVVLITLVVSFLSPVLSLVLISMTEDQATAKIIGTALPSILIGGIFSFCFLYKGKKIIDVEYWVYALKFNIPLIPHYLSGSILNQSDRIMIAKLISNSKAGIYSVAYNASFAISIVTTAINNSLVPWLYNQMKEDRHESIKIRTSMILSIFAVILLLFMLVIPEFMAMLAPPSYSEAIRILPILIMSVFFQFLYGIFGAVEFYYEKSIYVMLASVIAAAINIITNICFIPMFGYFAAAYTTLFCFIVMSCTHYLFLRIILRKQNIVFDIFDIKQMIIISGLFLWMGFLEVVLYGYVLVRYTVVAMICTIILSKHKEIVQIFKNKQ